MVPIRVLLVGIGGYGVNYVEALLGPDKPVGVDVVGVVDPVARRSGAWGVVESAEIPVFDDIEGFYDGNAADLAVISSPIHFHSAQVIGCLNHGSHVLCEKPVAPLYSQALEMAEAEKKTGKFAAVGYQLSFSRDVLAMKQDILNGVYGDPILFKAAHAVRRGAKYYARSSWAGRKEVNGMSVYDSPLSNACAHQLHNMLFLLGNRLETAAKIEVTDAKLYRGNPNVENFDIAAVHGRTESGVKVQYQTAHPLESNLGPMSLFQFSKGEIRSERGGFVGYLKNGTIIDYNQIPKGHRMQKLYDALNCVHNGTTPVCTIETAIPHVAVVNDLQKYPVIPIPEAQIHYWEQDGDRFWSVKGLEDKICRSYESEIILSLSFT